MKLKNIASPQSHIKLIYINLIFLISAVILFAAIFPNAIFRRGLGLLSFIALVPVGLLIQKIKLLASPLWGFLYGFFAYSLFNIWLLTFSPESYFVVPFIYACYFFVVFFVLKIAYKYFGNYAYLLQALFWLLYEYLRTTGFLGYSFGVLGYSLAFYPPLIQTADIFGVWGITLYLAAISFFLAQFVSELLAENKKVHILHLAHSQAHSQSKDQPHTANHSSTSSPITELLGTIKLLAMRRHYKYFIFSMLAISIFGLVYGILLKVDYSKDKTVRIALMQHATDPWEGGLVAYRTSLDILKAQTTEVMNSNNKPDLVIWSETAFVPSITYHLRYREVPAYYRMIQELLDYLGQYSDTEFLIGNGEGVKVKDDNGVLNRQDYNATLFFKGNIVQDKYFKIHLVPFTEHFPYKKLFPRFRKYLIEHDTHFWLAGNKHTVFKSQKVTFSTPICFEDGFGLQNAKFIRNGAEILVNVSNDAWSNVESNAMQHLQLAVFRTVENRRSMARSTNSGMTGVIDPNGKILAILPSFTQDYLVYDMPISTQKNTLYTRYGDWFVLFVCIFSVLFIISYVIIMKLKINKSATIRKETL